MSPDPYFSSRVPASRKSSAWEPSGTASFEVQYPLNSASFLPVPTLTRITHDPNIMGGKPCIRGLRVTVGTLVGMVAAGRSREEILRMYPYLVDADIGEALAYAAWRVEELEVPLVA